MAEIKSTIDLVMERTRNLTMSDEDRREQATAELRASVNGLTQKYLDGAINVERFQSEFSRLEGSSSNRRSAVAEVAKRIDPAGDNRLLLDLLRDGLEMEISGIEAILGNCGTTVESETRNAIDQLKNKLLQKGISGNAIIPNLETDAGWVEKREEILDKCGKELASEIAGLA